MMKQMDFGQTCLNHIIQLEKPTTANHLKFLVSDFIYNAQTHVFSFLAKISIFSPELYKSHFPAASFTGHHFFGFGCFEYNWSSLTYAHHVKYASRIFYDF